MGIEPFLCRFNNVGRRFCIALLPSLRSLWPLCLNSFYFLLNFICVTAFFGYSLFSTLNRITHTHTNLTEFIKRPSGNVMFIFEHLAYCVCCVRATQPCQRWRCFFFFFFTIYLLCYFVYSASLRYVFAMAFIRLYSGETHRKWSKKGLSSNLYIFTIFLTE